MKGKYLILSDVHGNVSAFDAVLEDCGNEEFEGIIILGDLIDYGMRSNEIISKLSGLGETLWKGKILSNIHGNHERILLDGDLTKLSSERGRDMARYTANSMDCWSMEYIRKQMNSTPSYEFDIEGLKCLAIHGSLADEYWKAISPGELGGNYAEYDMVFSGHSHLPHYFNHFYPSDDSKMRNRKSVTFINPGSVGQPRNQNPMAQYAVLSLPSRRVELRAVEYDVEYEQSLYPEEIDKFYRDRLALGV